MSPRVTSSGGCAAAFLHYVMLRGAKRIPTELLRDIGVAYANGAMHYELTFPGAPWTIINLRTRAEADWVAYELRRALSASG